MIQICIDARMAYSGGIGTCIRQLVPFLNQPPFQATLLVSQKEQSWCKGMKQIYVPASIYSIQEQVLLPLNIPSCDLFWSPHYNIPLLPIRAKKRVTTIHDACHLALSQSLSWPEKIYAKIMMEQALARSDAVVTDSQFSKEELIRFLGTRKRINFIPLAADRRVFQRIVDRRVFERMQTTYHLPNKFILFVGNLKPHKNLSGLLKGFALRSLQELELVIVGKSKGLKNSIEIREDRAVHILSEVPEEDLPALYSMAECFVFPSFYEGFGLPPLEAMSCGCPTIVSHSASLPEVCGDASLYVDPAKPEEIARAMDQFVNDPDFRNHFIKKGFEQVSKFQWEETARRYRELFMTFI